MASSKPPDCGLINFLRPCTPEATFSAGRTTPCLPSLSTPLIILVVYVDDILLAGDNVAKLDRLKVFLDEHIKIKDLGLVYYFLGLEVTEST